MYCYDLPNTLSTQLIQNVTYDKKNEVRILDWTVFYFLYKGKVQHALLGVLIPEYHFAADRRTYD